MTVAILLHKGWILRLLFMYWRRFVTGLEVAIGSTAAISKVAIYNGHCIQYSKLKRAQRTAFLSKLTSIWMICKENFSEKLRKNDVVEKFKAVPAHVGIDLGKIIYWKRHLPTVQFSNLADFYVCLTLISLSRINLYHRFKLWSRSARFSDDLQIWNGQIAPNGVLLPLSNSLL